LWGGWSSCVAAGRSAFAPAVRRPRCRPCEQGWKKPFDRGRGGRVPLRPFPHPPPNQVGEIRCTAQEPIAILQGRFQCSLSREIVCPPTSPSASNSVQTAWDPTCRASQTLQCVWGPRATVSDQPERQTSPGKNSPKSEPRVSPSKPTPKRTPGPTLCNRGLTSQPAAKPRTPTHQPTSRAEPLFPTLNRLRPPPPPPTRRVRPSRCLDSSSRNNQTGDISTTTTRAPPTITIHRDRSQFR